MNSRSDRWGIWKKVVAYHQQCPLRVAQILLLILACAWGGDYLNMPPKETLYVAERYINLRLWGWGFMTFGVMGLLGEWWMSMGRARHRICFCRLFRPENRWWPSFFAHAMLCAMYAALTAGCITELVIDGHFWGMRMVLGSATAAAGHWVFAERRRSCLVLK